MIAGPRSVATIERMTEGDIQAVSEIERQSFPTVWRVEAYAKELSNPSSCYLVARWEGRVIGFGGMWLVREGNLAAQQLYDGFGFEVIARIGHYYLDTGEDALVMRLRDMHKREYRSRLQQIEEKGAWSP